MAEQKRGRGRPKKMATPEQMETINEFIQQYSQDLSKRLAELDLLTKISSNQGIYNPILSEQYVNDVNFNPKNATSDDINKWLCAPQFYSENIRHLSQYLENAVGQYGRAIWALNTMKAFKYHLLPVDSNNSEEVNKYEYQHSYEIALDTLRKLNIKYQFSKIDLTVMQDGVAFYLIDEKNNCINLLQIPTDYCYITAPYAYGWLFAIDLTFFDRMVNLPNILPELTEAYNLFIEKRKDGYTGEKLAPYQYYNLPWDKSFCFTFDPNKASKIPPLTAAMGASIDVLSYRDLLKKKSLLDLWKLLAMKIPMNKDNNSMAIPYKEAKQIVAMVQSQMPDNYVAFATPFDTQEVQTQQINTMDKLIDVGDNNVFSALGMSSSAFGKENKQAGIMKISMNLTFAYASTHMYNQFANLVNMLIAKKTRKYRWQVKFFGNVLNHKEEVDMAKDAVTSANLPAEILMSSLGFEPFETDSFINWCYKKDLKSKLTPLQSMNTQSGDNKGRPEKDLGDLADGGEKSREYKEE